MWDGAAGEFLPPDAAERVFRRLGLEPVNALEKEVRAVDFDPADYALPASAWRDGPAAGVVLRDKTGNRASILGPELRQGGEPTPIEVDDLVDRLVTDRRIRRATDRLAERGEPVTVGAVVELVVEAAFREAAGRIEAGDGEVDPGTVRQVAAERVGRRLEAGDDD